MMQSRFIFVFIYSVLLAAGLVSCSGEPAAPKRSELFTTIFSPDSGLFRGVNPGIDAASIKKLQGSNPKHEDRLGLVYELNLGTNREGSVEYYLNSNHLASIVVNAFLANEAEAADLATEIENYLRTRYGAPTGNFGNYQWGPTADGIRVQLRMHESSRGLTLGFSIPPTQNPRP